MRRSAVRRGQLLGAFLPLLLLTASSGCRTKSTRPYQEPPPPGIHVTQIDYADSDAFDAVFETALTNQDPVILVQTDYEKPEWGGRLNAWIAAWSAGGKVEPARDGRSVRGQAPMIPGVTVDADSIREFRLLIERFMDRVESLARERSAWWMEERLKAQRVELLRPYNLRFHLDSDHKIQLIFFNGKYAAYHRPFVEALARPDPENGEDWTRMVNCSQCREYSTAGTQ